MKVQIIAEKELNSSVRLDGKYFLNSDAILSKVVEKQRKHFIELGSIANVFNPPIFKRQFCQDTPKAVMYCQSSDVCNSIEGSATFINKLQAEKVNAIVKEHQILVTGFGTIGNVKLVNSLANGIAYANNACRIENEDSKMQRIIYAFLSTKYGKAQLNKNASGSVVRYIEAPGIKKTLIPNFNDLLKNKISTLILESSDLRKEANILLKKAEQRLYENNSLKKLSKEDFEYFGHHCKGRSLSVFTISSSKINSTTINAFNYSFRIRKLIKYIKDKREWITLNDSLSIEKLFSTGSFPRLEIDSPKSVKLINQSDIFNIKVVGKKIARKNVKMDNLVKYGEILIASVGTLGENETFCRTIFANEEFENQLVSGEFIRMKTSDKVPSGYLFAWLASEYGFRLIRSTQTGTKLCRPIQSRLLEIPIPLLKDKQMNEIHELVCKAHTMKFNALEKENKAILIIEKEIESWQK